MDFEIAYSNGKRVRFMDEMFGWDKKTLSAKITEEECKKNILKCIRQDLMEWLSERPQKHPTTLFIRPEYYELLKKQTDFVENLTSIKGAELDEVFGLKIRVVKLIPYFSVFNLVVYSPFIIASDEDIKNNMIRYEDL